MEHETENLIIGAGPAGLAMAGRLRKLGWPFIILEKSDQIANAWHNHYDRLHLHTVKDTSHLPHKPFPEDYPRYVPRQKLVDYFDAYRAEMEIAPHFGQKVTYVKKVDGRWQTTTRTGDSYWSERVIVATGFNCVPNLPQWRGSSNYTGNIEHSHSYKNGRPYAGQKVLVVGMGNTGAEIALDLCEHGAQPYISVRGPVNIVPRDIFGRPTQLTAMLLAKLPNAIGDAIGVLVRKLTVGDLSEYGIQTPDEPPAAQLRKRGKTPVIDVGTLEMIKQGRIKMLPDIRRLTEDAVIFVDGQELQFAHIILATGYRPDIEAFIEDGSQLLNELGYPGVVVGTGQHAGLYFLGFDAYSTGGLLLSIQRDSAAIAADIAKSVGQPAEV